MKRGRPIASRLLVALLFGTPCLLACSSDGAPVDVDLTDRAQLKLVVMATDDGKAWDRALWANARIECAD